MSTIFDNDILIHHIAAPGLPGDGFTAPEAAAIRDDLDTLLARPVITSLDAIPDVDAAGALGGQALVFDDSAGTWSPSTIQGGIRADNGDPDLRFGPVTIISVRKGIQVVQHPTVPQIAFIENVFGTTANTVAAGNHTHPIPSVSRLTFDPQGYMSSSTRPLTSLNVGLPAGKTCLVEARVKMQLRGGDTGASYYTLNLNINGDTRSSKSGVDGFWCVQGVPDKPEWSHHQTLVGTGSTINVAASISWNSGGGFYTDAGELEVKITYNR